MDWRFTLARKTKSTVVLVKLKTFTIDVYVNVNLITLLLGVRIF